VAVREMRARSRNAVVVARHHKPVGVVCDRDILSQACGDVEALDQVPVEAVMFPCTPLRETATVGFALRCMCSMRRWHLPLVCARGLLLGSVDVTDVSLWLRDRMTLMSIDAALGQVWARGG
jgi:predicted transcriptional regulator